MKIGILTLPLHNNYGGLLQNYALQTVLKMMGYDVYTINVESKRKLKFRRFASILKRASQRVLDKQIRVRTWLTSQEAEVISQNTRQFINKNIVTTELISKRINLNCLNVYNFDAYIVGSDQVWRPRYSPQLSTYFLDFLENTHDVKKIAYAASFGVDDWEFTKSETIEFKRLVKLFNAVSVREDSAVGLCSKHFDVKAKHLLDPTMLVDREVYISLVDEESASESPGNLFTYILDSSNEKNSIVDKIANKHNLKPFAVMPKIGILESGSLNDRIFPSVEDWIKGFIDAQFVVTDSFHGTVFSIIFNKPFISIANEGRGADRFFSLLRLFNLEDRLVSKELSFSIDALNKINWTEVNKTLEEEKFKSIKFIQDHLTKSN